MEEDDDEPQNNSQGKEDSIEAQSVVGKSLRSEIEEANCEPLQAPLRYQEHDSREEQTVEVAGSEMQSDLESTHDLVNDPAAVENSNNLLIANASLAIDPGTNLATVAAIGGGNDAILLRQDPLDAEFERACAQRDWEIMRVMARMNDLNQQKLVYTGPTLRSAVKAQAHRRVKN